MRTIATPFGFHSTASEVIQGIDLSGKRALVTGGAAGIGVETIKALASAGAAVTVAIRRPEAAEVPMEQIRSETGNRDLFVQRDGAPPEGNRVSEMWDRAKSFYP